MNQAGRMESTEARPVPSRLVQSSYFCILISHIFIRYGHIFVPFHKCLFTINTCFDFAYVAGILLNKINAEMC